MLVYNIIGSWTRSVMDITLDSGSGDVGSIPAGFIFKVLQSLVYSYSYCVCAKNVQNQKSPDSFLVSENLSGLFTICSLVSLIKTTRSIHAI